MTTPNTRGHTFDDIEEFDNRLPNWWLWTFYLSCIFSVVYWIHYHSLKTGDHPSELYVAEQKAAAARDEAAAANNPITEDSLQVLAKNPAIVEEGRKIFQDATKCALCHKPDGSGNIGPNLTDDMWIYGGKAMDIYTSIAKGRPGGMLPHEIYGTTFVQRSTAYVLSLKGKNLPGKPPEPNAKKE